MAALRDASNSQGRHAGHIGVRGLAVAVIGSVLVHVLALAWVTARELAVPVPPAPPTPAPAPRPAPAAEPPVLEVVFLDDPRAPVTGDAGAVVAATAGTAPRRIVRGGGAAAGASPGESPGETTGAAPGRSSYLTMRRPGREPMQGPSGSFLDDFLSRSKPIPPPPDIPGERVNDQIADLRARLKRAGRYSPDELAAMRAELVALYDERDAEELKSAGGGTYKSTKETFRAKVDADGSVKLEDREENLDTQDRMMKRLGIDPYARAKLAYLDRTRDQRVAVGKRHREQQLARSVVFMQRNIARLEAMTRDPARRKQGLFELWDECLETGTPEEIAGGESARAFVMAHIRATVRYTPAELRALDARRRSKQVFAP